MDHQAEATYALHFEPEYAHRCQEALDELDQRLTAAGIGEVAGSMDMGGLDFVVVVDLASDTYLPMLKALLVALGLDRLCAVERAEEADEDWEDDEDDPD